MKYLLAAILFLSGCATVAPLDTNNKKLFAAEVAWQEAAQLYLASKSRLSESSKDKVFDLLDDSHKALVAARLALSVGNELDFTNYLTTANSLIQVLRPILIELEEENVSLEHYSFA